MSASTASPSPSSTSRLAAGDWPTYHHDAQRSGVSTGAPTVGPLRRAWATKLDGQVYAQPLVLGSRVIAATENDSLYGLDSGSGRLLWRAHVGTPVPLDDLPCGNIDPLGITGTPVYDPATRRVFAVAEVTGAHHLLVAVDVATGRVALRRPLEPPKGDRHAHQQRGALALTGGRVYVPYGGLAGDCGDYIGSVVSVRTDGSAPLSFAVPTTREGGIWAPGGIAVSAGRLYVAVGNGESTASYDGSDSVTALSPMLQRHGYFAPDTWAADNRVDADLGSMSPAIVGERIFIAGKSGKGYLLRKASLGGIGGELASGDVCDGFGAAAVAGSSVFVPCTDGIRQVQVSGDHMSPGWHAAVNADGPPVVGGGAVWALDHTSGVLYALDVRSGRVRGQYDAGSVSRFASPALGGGRAYVPTERGIVAVTSG